MLSVFFPSQREGLGECLRSTIFLFNWRWGQRCFDNEDGIECLKSTLTPPSKTNRKTRRKPSPNPSQREGNALRVTQSQTIDQRNQTYLSHVSGPTSQKLIGHTNVLFWRTDRKMKSEGRTNPWSRIHFNGASVRSRNTTNCGQP